MERSKSMNVDKNVFIMRRKVKDTHREKAHTIETLALTKKYVAVNI